MDRPVGFVDNFEGTGEEFCRILPLGLCSL